MLHFFKRFLQVFILSFVVFFVLLDLRVHAADASSYAIAHRTSLPYVTSYYGGNVYLYYDEWISRNYVVNGGGAFSGRPFTRAFNMKLSNGIDTAAVCLEASLPAYASHSGSEFYSAVYTDSGFIGIGPNISRALLANQKINSFPKFLPIMRILYAAGLDNEQMFDHIPGSDNRYRRVVAHIVASGVYSGQKDGVRDDGYLYYLSILSYNSIDPCSYVISASESSTSVSADSVGLDNAYTLANPGYYYSEPFSFTGISIVPDDAGVEIVPDGTQWRFKVPASLVTEDYYATSASIAGLSSGGSSNVVLHILHVCIPNNTRNQTVAGVSNYFNTSTGGNAKIYFSFGYFGDTPPLTPPPWTFTLSKVDANTMDFITTGTATVGFYSDASCTSPVTVSVDGTDCDQVTLPKDRSVSIEVDGTIQVVYIKELSAPSGYMVSSDTYAGRPNLDIKIRDEVPVGEVTLIKKDSDTGSSVTGNDYSLDGARYELVADQDMSYPGKGKIFASGQVIATVEVGKSYAIDPTTGLLKSTVNGASGQICVSGLLSGKYHFKEITAPTGFNIDTETISFTIGSTPTELIKEVASNESEVRAPFKFTKLSVELNSTITHPYAGKEFKLYRAEDIASYLGLTYDSSLVGGGIDWSAQNLREVDWTDPSLAAMKLITNAAGTKSLVVSSANAGLLKTTTGGIFTNGSYADYVMTSDADGTVMSLPLPYGSYVVRETNCAEDFCEMRPFVVSVTEDSGSDTNILSGMDYGDKKNYPFGGRIHISKIDSLTGRNIYIEGVGFQVFKSDDNGATYSSTPLVIGGEDTFYTDSNGICYFGGTDYDLGFGYYMIKEVKSTTPNGYIYDDGYYISVKIANESLIEYHYGLDISEYDGKAALRSYMYTNVLKYTTVYDADDKPTNTFSIKYDNIPDTGALKITKNGKGALVSWTEADGFTYDTQLFNGARYAIYAAEDIYTYDHYTVGGQRTTYYKEGDLVSYILQSSTDTEPEEYIETGYNYELWYYDTKNAGCTQPLFTVTSGSIGVTEISGLPLGKYVIKEVQAPEGHTLSDTEYAVTLSQGDVDITTPNVVNKTYTNERQRVALKIKKLVFSTVEQPIAGRKFDLYAAEDIKNYSGTTIVTAGTWIGSGISGADGYVEFSNGDTLPFAKYYIVEELVSDNIPDVQLSDPMEYSVSKDWLTVYSGTAPALIYTYNSAPHTVDVDNGEQILIADITWNASTQTEDAADYETKLWNVVSALTVLKTDAFTGRPVAGARMTLTGPEGFVADAASAVSMGFANASVSVSGGKTIVTFTSTIDGALISSPMVGDYVLEEISAPTGYYLAEKAWVSSSSDFAGTTYNNMVSPKVSFSVTSSSDGYYTVVMYDVPKTGRLEVSKLGEMISGYNGLTFTYADGYLQNAEYTVTAAETIYAYDGSGAVLYNPGDIVAVIKTGYGVSLSWGDDGIKPINIGHGSSTSYKYVGDGNGDYVENALDPWGEPTYVGAGNGYYTKVVTPGYIDTYATWSELIRVNPTAPNDVTNAMNSVGLTGEAMYVDSLGEVQGGTKIVLGDTYVYDQLLADNPNYLYSGELTNMHTYGTAYLKGLPFGTYKITETKAPAGYILDSVTNTATVTISESSDTASKSFRNKRLKFELDVFKYNYAVTQDEDGNPRNVPLKGIEFGLFAGQNFMDGKGNLIISEGDLIQKVVSDENGHVPFNVSDLPGGYYYIVDYGTYSYLECEASLVNSNGQVVNTGANGDYIEDATSLHLECGKTHSINPITGLMADIDHPVFRIELTADGVSTDATSVVRKVDIFNKYYTIEVEKHAYDEWWAYLAGEISDPAPLTGAMMKISNAAGTWSYTWVTGTEPAIIVVPAAGDYTITEISAPVGYYKIEPYTFTVETEDYLGGTYLNILDLPEKDSPRISKIDIVTGSELPGAHLHIEDSDGNIIDSWTSTSIPYEFDVPSDGTYTLVEDAAPAGYDIATSITFEIKDEKVVGSSDNKVVMKDKPDTGLVEICKVDITTNEELPGAHLKITDSSDNVIDQWVSTDEKHYVHITTSGTYTLTEITAPDGYYKAESITFTVDVTSHEVTQVVMKDKPISYISKIDVTTGKELPGALLEIVNSSGDVVDHWTSTNTPHVFGILKPDNTYDYELPDGKYTLIENTAPTGYYKASSVEFEVKNGAIVGGKVTMEDLPIGYVEISKVDITNEKELPGAKLEITDKNGHVIDSWTSGTKPHFVRINESGEYTLTEITAPKGYEVAESITFTVDVVDASKTTTKVVMKDKPTPEVVIKKLDLQTGKYVVGAKLQITDSNGKVVDSWTTTSDAHSFKPSSAGTYTLTEVSVPYGYLKADPVTFTVRFDGKAEDTVIMYDKPISSAGIIRLRRPTKPAPYVVPRTDSTGELGSSVKIEPFDGNGPVSPKTIIGCLMIILALVGLVVIFIMNRHYIKSYPLPVIGVIGVTTLIAIGIIIYSGRSENVNGRSAASSSVSFDNNELEPGTAAQVVDAHEELIDDRNYVYVDYNFTSYNPESTYAVPQTITKDGREYVYTGEVQYETQSVTPIAVYVAQKALLVDESMDSSYSIPLISGSNLSLPLYRTSASDPAIVDYTVTKTVDFDEGTEISDVPSVDTITYYNEILGIDMTIDASRIGDIERVAQQYNDGEIVATFEASDPAVEIFLIEDYEGDPVAASETADAPYFENYAAILTELVGGGVENFTVTGGEWTGEIYEENGVYKRDAVFHYSGLANVLRAIYEGTGEAYGYNAAAMYMSQLSGDQVNDVPSEYLRSLYGIKATAKYVEKT